MSVSQDPLVQTLIERRMQANLWTEEAAIKYFSMVIDGEGTDDGISSKINEANNALATRFKALAGSISAEDIQTHLDKVVSNAPDWLAHLDIAFHMAQAKPDAVTVDHIKKMVGVTKEPGTVKSVTASVANIRPEQAARFLDSLGLKAA